MVGYSLVWGIRLGVCEELKEEWIICGGGGGGWGVRGCGAIASCPSYS